MKRSHGLRDVHVARGKGVQVIHTNGPPDGYVPPSASLTPPVVHYHGGAPGLHSGDMLFPPTRTGMRARRAEALHPGYDPSRVYVTSSLRYASVFAWACGGAVYEVQPEGQVRVDGDAPADAPSWSCRRARILRVALPAPVERPEGLRGVYA